MVNEAIYYSALAGFSTVLGPLIAMVLPLSRQAISFSFGVSSGVMLLVAYATLLPSAMQMGGILHVMIGMVFAVLLMLCFRRLPLDHHHGNMKDPTYERLGFYLILAIIVHNIPEGIAIGLGFETEHEAGMLLVLALAIHNIPEGMAMALPLIARGHHPIKILAMSLLCGSALPIGTWIGMNWLINNADMIAISLIFSATIMIWIVIYEVFPQAFRLGRKFSVYGLLAGGIFMYIVHRFHG